MFSDPDDSPHEPAPWIARVLVPWVYPIGLIVLGLAFVVGLLLRPS